MIQTQNEFIFYTTLTIPGIFPRATGSHRVGKELLKGEQNRKAIGIVA